MKKLTRFAAALLVVFLFAVSVVPVFASGSAAQANQYTDEQNLLYTILLYLIMFVVSLALLVFAIWLYSLYVKSKRKKMNQQNAQNPKTQKKK